MSDSEKFTRHFSRIPFDVAYRISESDKHAVFTGHVIDLSLKGALIERPENLSLQIGEVLLLDLLLGADDVHIQMQVRVAHLHEKTVGVVCEHLDLDSMTHLRRVIELNLGSHQLLERELDEMIQLNTH